MLIFAIGASTLVAGGAGGGGAGYALGGGGGAASLHFENYVESEVFGGTLNKTGGIQSLVADHNIDLIIRQQS